MYLFLDWSGTDHKHHINLMSFDVSAASGWVRLRFLQTELLNHTRSAHEASGSA
jgi:hypothetical protein